MKALYTLFIYSCLLTFLTVPLKAQKSHRIVQEAMDKAQTNRTMAGKFYLAVLDTEKVIDLSVIEAICANQYGIRNVVKETRPIFGKMETTVLQFEFRDLALIEQDRLIAERKRKEAEIRRAEEQERRRQLAIAAAAEAAAKANADPASALIGLWISSDNEILAFRKNNTLTIQQLNGESVGLLWQFSDTTRSVVVSNDDKTYVPLAKVNFTSASVVNMTLTNGDVHRFKATNEGLLRLKAFTNALWSNALNAILSGGFNSSSGGRGGSYSSDAATNAYMRRLHEQQTYNRTHRINGY